MKKSLMIILAAMIFIALFSTSCKLEDMPSTPCPVSPSPTIMTTPMTTPTVTPEPTPTPTPTPTPSPEPTPSPMPTPVPTYAPPSVRFDGHNINIGDDWITATLPDGFVGDKAVDGELFRAYYDGDEDDGVFAMEIIQDYVSDHDEEGVNRLDEYLGFIEYTDYTCERVKEHMVFGYGTGYYSVIEGQYQDNPMACHMAVVTTKTSYYVLYIYGLPDGLLSDPEWVTPIMESLDINPSREIMVAKKRYQDFDEESRVLTSEFAPCQITLPNQWYSCPTNRFLDSYIVMAGEHQEGSTMFNVYRYAKDDFDLSLLETLDFEQIMVSDRIIHHMNNGLLAVDDDLDEKPIGEDFYNHIIYITYPREDFIIAFIGLVDQDYGYLLELWTFSEDMMSEDEIMDLVKTFTFTDETKAQDSTLCNRIYSLCR